MKYIFFDIDGVLNGTDENGNLIDDEIHIDKVNNLIKIVKATGAKLVMSSSWRRNWDENGNLKSSLEPAKLLTDLLIAADCPIYSITPFIDYERDKEIKEWLSQYAVTGSSFVCLDDEKSYYKNDVFFNNKFIHTAPAHCDGAYGHGDVVGLFDSHVTKAISILNT